MAWYNSKNFVCTDEPPITSVLFCLENLPKKLSIPTVVIEHGWQIMAQVRPRVLPCPLQNPWVLNFEDVSECGKVLDSEFLESGDFRYKARRLKEDNLNSVQ